MSTLNIDIGLFLPLLITVHCSLALHLHIGARSKCKSLRKKLVRVICSLLKGKPGQYFSTKALHIS